MTANNRIMPDTSKFDVGTTMTNTGRSMRLKELIESGINGGKKFTSQDMINMQQDMTDVVAREITPHILKITNFVIQNAKSFQINEKNLEIIKSTSALLNDFGGEMTE